MPVGAASSSEALYTAEYKTVLKKGGSRKREYKAQQQQHHTISFTLRYFRQNPNQHEITDHETLQHMWEEMSVYKFFSDMNMSFFTNERNPALFARFMSRAFLLSANEGTVIVRQGDIGDTFFVLLSGSAHVVIETEEERKASKNAWKDWLHCPYLDVYAPGQSFGELSLLSDEPQPRNATIVAVTPTVLLRVEKQDYLDLIKLKHETFLRGILSFLESNNLFQASARGDNGSLVEEDWAFLFTTNTFARSSRTCMPVDGNIHFVTCGEAYLYRKGIGIIARLRPGDFFGHEKGLPSCSYFNITTMLVLSTNTLRTLSISRWDFLRKIVTPNHTVLYPRLCAYTCAREVIMTLPAQRNVDQVEVLMLAFPCIVDKIRSDLVGFSSTSMNQLYQALQIEMLVPGTAIDMKDVKDKFGVLLSGSMSLYATSVDSGGSGRESLMGDMTPGDHFGELELLHNTMTSTKIVANTHAYVGYLDRDVFGEVFDVEEQTYEEQTLSQLGNPLVEISRMVWPFKYAHLYQFMKRIEAFSTIENSVLMQLTRSVQVITVGVDNVIILQGARSSGVYFILEGQCAVLKEIKRQGSDEGGKEAQKKQRAHRIIRQKEPKPIVLNVLSAGQYFGESCLFASSTYNCSFKSVSKRVRLLYINAKQFEHLLSRKTLARFRSIHLQREKWRKERGHHLLSKFQSVLHVVERKLEPWLGRSVTLASSAVEQSEPSLEASGSAAGETRGPPTSDASLQEVLRTIISDEVRMPVVGLSQEKIDENVDVAHHPLHGAISSAVNRHGDAGTTKEKGVSKHHSSSMLKAAVKSHGLATKRLSLYAIVQKRRVQESSARVAAPFAVTNEISTVAMTTGDLLDFVRIRKSNRKMKMVIPGPAFSHAMDADYNLTDSFSSAQRWTFAIESVMRQLRVARQWKAVAQVTFSVSAADIHLRAKSEANPTSRPRRVRKQSLLQGTRLVTSPDVASKSGIDLSNSPFAVPSPLGRLRGKRNTVLLVSTLRTSKESTMMSTMNGPAGHIAVKAKSRLSALHENRDGFAHEKVSATFLTAMNEENNQQFLMTEQERLQAARALVAITDEEQALTARVLEEAVKNAEYFSGLRDVHPMEDHHATKHVADATILAYPHGQHLKDPLNEMTATNHSLDGSVLLSAAGERSAVFSKFQAKERRSFVSDMPRVSERAELVAKQKLRRQRKSENKRINEMLVTQWANISKAEDEQEFSHKTVTDIRSTIFDVQHLIYKQQRHAKLHPGTFERVRWQHNNSEIEQMYQDEEDFCDGGGFPLFKVLLTGAKHTGDFKMARDGCVDGQKGTNAGGVGGTYAAHTPWMVKNMHGDDIDIAAALRDEEEEDEAVVVGSSEALQRAKDKDSALVPKMSIVLWITGLNFKRSHAFGQLQVQSMFDPTLSVLRLYTSPLCNWVFIEFVPSAKHTLHRVVATIHERLDALGQEHWSVLKITQEYMKQKLFQGMIAERTSIDDLQDVLNATDLQRKVRRMLRNEGKASVLLTSDKASRRPLPRTSRSAPYPRKPMAPKQTPLEDTTRVQTKNNKPVWTSPFLAQPQVTQSARRLPHSARQPANALSANNRREVKTRIKRCLVVNTLHFEKPRGMGRDAAPMPRHSRGFGMGQLMGRPTLVSRSDRVRVRAQQQTTIRNVRSAHTTQIRNVRWAGNKFRD